MKSCLFLSLTLLLTPSLLAQQQTFVIRPDASQVSMTLNTTHEVVHGTFHVQSGSIDFDRSLPKMSGSIVVLAGSGNTGNGSRDKNKDILLVDTYRTVSFEPKSYTGTIQPKGDSTLQVTGIFTLLGRPHELTVPMLVHIDGANVLAKTHFIVPYVAWGLKNPSLLIWKADNDVTIDLVLAGTLSQ
jgi:polyisoprenoid-binding protein YceI